MGRFYITTPIYYVNDVPHAGHAYCTVNADAMARFHRLVGDQTLFLTGTDEHGQKVAEAAARQGLTPIEWTDRTSERFREAWALLDVANDDFIRTTEDRHRRTVQSFLQRIYDNGYIFKAPYRGLYCVSCEDYYTAEQLNDGRCPVHGTPAVEMAEDNWFFQLSAFTDRLLDYYAAHPEFVLPETKRNEALAFIRGGLHDISITRTSIDWGVEVPWDPAHVFYVWYDALVNYLTAIGYGADPDEVATWWPASNHLIGKEILRFHCVWWPAMCFAAGIEPPHHVQVHGWLLVGGQKLSKSATGGPIKLADITPASLVSQFGCDPVRYHLLRDTPLGSDGEFSLESIIARYNSDLANNLGNLVARVATVVGAKCGGVGPAPSAADALRADIVAATDAARRGWEQFAPHHALEATWKLIGAANGHLERHEPWKMSPGVEVDGVLGDALEAIRAISVLVTPAMPSTAAEIRRRIGVGPLDPHGGWATIETERYPGGVTVTKGDPLFPRIRSDD